MQLRNLLALLFLLLAVPAYPWSLVGTIGAPAAGGCSTPALGDLMNEGFEGTANGGFENASGWTNGGSLDADATPPGGFNPTNGCSQALYLNSTDNTFNYAVYDLGSAKTDAYIRFTIYIDSYTLANYNGIAVFSSSPNSSDPEAARAANLSLYQNAGGLMKWKSASSGGESAELSAVLDTTYYVEIYHYSGGGSTCYVNIGTSGFGSGTNTTYACGFNGVRYLYLGRTSNANSAHTVEAYYDTVHVDDDGTWP